MDSTNQCRDGSVESLVAAIEWQAHEFESRVGIRCELNLPGDQISVGDDLSAAVFGISQEPLTNIARHAEATNVDMFTSLDNEGTALEIRDNEITRQDSLGLSGIPGRGRFHRGRVEIKGRPGGGTTVNVEILVDTSNGG